MSSTHFVTPFSSKHSWEHGEIHFNFVDGTVRGGKSAWDALQAHRGTKGVMGIAHCPSSSNLRAAYDEYLAALADYPDTLFHHFLAFDLGMDDLGRGIFQGPSSGCGWGVGKPMGKRVRKPRSEVGVSVVLVRFVGCGVWDWTVVDLNDDAGTRVCSTWSRNPLAAPYISGEGGEGRELAFRALLQSSTTHPHCNQLTQLLCRPVAPRRTHCPYHLPRVSSSVLCILPRRVTRRRYQMDHRAVQICNTCTPLH